MGKHNSHLVTALPNGSINPSPSILRSYLFMGVGGVYTVDSAYRKLCDEELVRVQSFNLKSG